MDTAVSEMQGMNTMQYKYADTCIKLSYNHAILQYHMYKYPPHPHHRARATGRKKEREQKVKAVFMSAQARRASREPGPRIEGGIYIYVCVCGVPRTHRAPKRPHLFCFGVPQVWEKIYGISTLVSAGVLCTSECGSIPQFHTICSQSLDLGKS